MEPHSLVYKASDVSSISINSNMFVSTLNFSSDKPNLGTPIDGEKCTGGQPKYQMNDMEIYELP